MTNLDLREKLPIFVLTGLALFFTAFWGARYLQTPSKIVVKDGSDVQVGPSVTGERTDSKVKVAEPPEPIEVVIDVAGAVKKPGIVRMKAGSRVHEAIELSGGARDDADTSQLNMAAKLEDGTQLVVPTKQAVPPGASDSPAPVTEKVSQPTTPKYQGGKPVPSYSSKPESSSGSETSGIVNINTGSQSDLERLPGIGPVTAAAIVAYRKQRGGFTSVDDLLDVKGIGPKKLEAMRPYVRL